MDTWSGKKKATLIIILAVVLIAIIAVAVIFFTNTVPDADKFLDVNNLDYVTTEYEGLTVKYGNSVMYFEKNGYYLNYTFGNISGDNRRMVYTVNEKNFQEENGKFYYTLARVNGSSADAMDPYIAVEEMINEAFNGGSVTKKGGKYMMTVEKVFTYDNSKTVYELYFGKNLLIQEILERGKDAVQKFMYGEKMEYPDHIKNYDSGDKVTVTAVNLINNRTDTFEIKKGTMFHLAYSDIIKQLEFYLDEECTILYSGNYRSPEPVNEDITIYVTEKG